MADQTGEHQGSAPAERRAAALEAAFEARGMKAADFIDDHSRLVEEEWVPRNGARLLDNGRDAVSELGLTMPPHHRHLVVLENTPTVHNVIVCTQCSCTAYTVIGLPPDWYKDFEYRARVVRESRTVLREMGLDLPREIEIRVWDTTADTRYMVLPVQPPSTLGWPEDKLVDVVTKDSMIGVSRL
jgi:nitrile hydratase